MIIFHYIFDLLGIENFRFATLYEKEGMSSSSFFLFELIVSELSSGIAGKSFSIKY